MKCLNPQSFHKDGTYLACGGCNPCRINRQKEWLTKLLLEAKTFPNPVFVTLTYNQENLPPFNSLSKKHLQDFMKRLRKNVNSVTPNHKIRFFGVGEYGEKLGRPHYHLIIYNIDLLLAEKLVKKSWKNGHVQVGAVRKGGMRYVSGYTLKKMTTEQEVIRREGAYPPRLPEFSLMSRKPALGAYNLPVIAEKLKKHGLYPNAVLTPEQKMQARDLDIQFKNFNGIIKIDGLSAKIELSLLEKLADMIAPHYRDWLDHPSVIVPKELKAFKRARHHISFNDTMEFKLGDEYEQIQNKSEKTLRKDKASRNESPF